MKHIAPYLPYKVQIQVIDICMDVETFETYEETYITTLDTRRLDYFKEDMKLILRPISSLTTDQMTYLEDKHGKMIDGYYECKRHFIERTNDLPYDIVQSLLELHCDLFGLIESGQAIDINTLNT